jgi:hypothetical protein
LWMPGYADWVWVPAHYVWTPRGYVFIAGYWDYPATRRGVLFAPVRFRTVAAEHLAYTPATVIDLDVFHDHLFVRASDYHYYFGDYYAARHDLDILPIFSFHLHQGYDPLFAHVRWAHRGERNWEHEYEARYQQRREHEDARPPHTLAQVTVHGGAHERAIAAPLAQWARSASASVRLRAVSTDERQRLVQREADVRRFRRERQAVEVESGKSREKATNREVKATLPRSPIVGKVTKVKVNTPKAPPEPKPDKKIVPQPRRP